MEADYAIKVDRVVKIFKLPHERTTSVKSAIVGFAGKKKGYELQKALKDVSFDVKKGEFFGIVGRNGSGKSTLLKTIAGIYTPNEGSVKINGSLTPFIELGVGFNPELTGRDNVFLNGALLGFSRKEMKQKYKDIVEFAELTKFMDQKLKNYSSGMQVRLAFSIAIQAKSEILVLDEVLAVGDLDFQKKCYSYFFDLKREQRTIIFVSHDMAAVRRFCTRCILIKDGQLVAEGSPEKIADMYEQLNLRAAEVRLEAKPAGVVKQKRQGNGEALIEKVETFDPASGKKQNTFQAGEKIGVRIIYKAVKAVTEPAVGFIFQNETDLTVFATNNQIRNQKTKDLAAGDQLVAESIIENSFTDGEYTITAAIESTDFQQIYDRIEYIHKFMIGGHKLAHALTHPTEKLKLSYRQE